MRCSSSEAILAIAIGQDVHHFVEGRNLEIQNGAVVHQSIHYWCGGTEQLELNIMVVCPTLEKREHSQAPAADRLHGGKIQGDDAGFGLLSYNIAKLENRFTLDDPALTLNYCEVVQVLNAYGHHRILRLLIAARTVPGLRSLFISLIRHNEVLKPSTFGRLSGNVFLQRTLYLPDSNLPLQTQLQLVVLEKDMAL